MIRNNVTRVTMLLCVIALAAAPLFASPYDKGGRNDRGGDRGRSYGSTVYGTVSAVNGAMIQILNGIVTIDATNATIFSDDKRGRLTVAMITVGTEIEVYGVAGPTPNTIVANMIEVKGPRADGKIRGAITAVDAANNTITVLGTVITVNAQTVFESRRGMKFGPANLIVGAIVEVEVAVAQTKLLALEIEFGGGR